MLEGRTYSIADLEQLTGFNRRTIVYYIHEGLLPKPGRRGPRTRYAEACLLRLRFIRTLKDKQDQGLSGTVTLTEMRRALDRVELPVLRALLERGLPSDELDALLGSPLPPPVATTEAPLATPASPATAATLAGAPDSIPGAAAAPVRGPSGDRRSYGLADAGIRQRFGGPPTVPPAAAPPAQPAPEDTEPRLPVISAPGPGAIPDNLGDLLRELELRPARSGRRLPPGASEQWTEIPITSRIYLSVRGLPENDAPLADAAGRALKKLLRSR